MDSKTKSGGAAMCGVAGIFAYHYAAAPVDRGELRVIRDAMEKRGPDGFGEWFSEVGV